jgi:hypothetical protein
MCPNTLEKYKSQLNKRNFLQKVGSLRIGLIHNLSLKVSNERFEKKKFLLKKKGISSYNK